MFEHNPASSAIIFTNPINFHFGAANHDIQNSDQFSELLEQTFNDLRHEFNDQNLRYAVILIRAIPELAANYEEIINEGDNQSEAGSDVELVSESEAGNEWNLFFDLLGPHASNMIVTLLDSLDFNLLERNFRLLSENEGRNEEQTVINERIRNFAELIVFTCNYESTVEMNAETAFDAKIENLTLAQIGNLHNAIQSFADASQAEDSQYAPTDSCLYKLRNRLETLRQESTPAGMVSIHSLANLTPPPNENQH